jgi:hypothetical protein
MDKPVYRYQLLPQILFREENSLTGNICFCVVYKRDSKKYKDYEMKK